MLKIISGGQTGADIAALKAAKFCNFETGGNIPKNYRTLDGSKPEYALEYNMIESHSFNYSVRTEENVKNSNGTIRFATNFQSAGERCTLKAIKWFNKPYLDIKVNEMPSVESVVDWITQNDIKVLNIAGNSEATSPGIEIKVFDYMCLVLQFYNSKDQS